MKKALRHISNAFRLLVAVAGVAAIYTAVRNWRRGNRTDGEEE